VPTTHYRASLARALALERAPALSRWRVEGAWTWNGFPELRADVWLDDEGRVRRLVSHHAMGSMRFDELDAPVDLPFEVERDLRLSDLGGDFEVALPPRSSVRVDKTMVLIVTAERLRRWWRRRARKRRKT
jgi:hypothetical protein